jgi:hypothetical protein
MRLKLILVALLLACSSLPNPCDPEVLTTRLAAEATACRIQAEKTCPGYANMTEDKKLECPGVIDCLERLESMKVSCNGN